MAALRRFWRDRDGSVAVEFAFVSVLLFAALLAVLEFGRALYVRSELGYALDSAARVALINPDATAEVLEAAMRARLNLGRNGDVGFSRDVINRPDATYTALRARYSFDLLLSPVWTDTITLEVEKYVPLN